MSRLAIAILALSWGSVAAAQPYYKVMAVRVGDGINEIRQIPKSYNYYAADFDKPELLYEPLNTSDRILLESIGNWLVQGSASSAPSQDIEIKYMAPETSDAVLAPAAEILPLFSKCRFLTVESLGNDATANVSYGLITIQCGDDPKSNMFYSGAAVSNGNAVKIYTGHVIPVLHNIAGMARSTDKVDAQ